MRTASHAIIRSKVNCAAAPVKGVASPIVKGTNKLLTMISQSNWMNHCFNRPVCESNRFRPVMRAEYCATATWITGILVCAVPEGHGWGSSSKVRAGEGTKQIQFQEVWKVLVEMTADVSNPLKDSMSLISGNSAILRCNILTHIVNLMDRAKSVSLKEKNVKSFSQSVTTLAGTDSDQRRKQHRLTSRQCRAPGTTTK